MSSAGCFLEKAIEIVKDAAKNDNEKNYEEAYKQYTSSLEYFILALKCKCCVFNLEECVKTNPKDGGGGDI